MAVENFICESCICGNVCAVRKTLLKFDENAKNPLPTNIEILSCEDYKAIKREE